MLQMKVYICCKTFSNRIRIQEKAFKNRKPATSFLVVPGGKKNTIKLIKVFLVECPPVTSINKAIVITDICQTDMETITELGDQWI